MSDSQIYQNTQMLKYRKYAKLKNVKVTTTNKCDFQGSDICSFGDLIDFDMFEILHFLNFCDFLYFVMFELMTCPNVEISKIQKTRTCTNDENLKTCIYKTVTFFNFCDFQILPFSRFRQVRLFGIL